MTDLSGLSVDELAEKVRGWWSTGSTQDALVFLDELMRRASERDQAVRERDEARRGREQYGRMATEYRERADRLAAALDEVLDATENNNELSCEQRVRKAHQIAYDALAADQEQAAGSGELCECGNRVTHLNRDTGKCWSCS